jgi:N-acetylmuramoyl-L-alanine amidase
MTIEQKFLPNSKWTRPGIVRQGTKAIVMHWIAAPGQTPEQVIEFWKNRKNAYGSAHYVIGTEGRVVQTLPENEVAYHCGSQTYTPYATALLGKQATSNKSKGTPNHFSIGIEMSHIDWEGTFTEDTLESAARLCAQLCKRYKLDPFKHITTHNMIVGWKDCPKQWVKEPWRLELFKRYVASLL